MEADASYAQMLQQGGINLQRTATGLAPRTPPSGWTWHHAPVSGVMQLVPRSQHTPGSIFWDSLHPGGRGGLLDLGSVMKLIEVIRDLESLDEEDTIYAAEPWNEDAEGIVAREPDAGGLPAEAEERGLKYFLEVFVVRDFAADWSSELGARPSVQQKQVRSHRCVERDRVPS
jgi:hypothetical protein